MKMRKRALMLAMLWLALGLAACGNSTAASLAPPTANVRVSQTPLATLPPQAVAANSVDSGVVAAPPLPELPENAKKGGKITIAASGPLATDLHPTPTTASLTEAWGTVANLIWANGLISYNYATLQWQLEMAQEVKVDPTGKIFTFVLRPDLKWSDGSPITPDDFQFASEGMAKENKFNPAGNFAGVTNRKRISSFKADAASNSVIVTFPETYARDVALNYAATPPIPKKVWEGKSFFDGATNPEIKKPTVVDGPYMLASYDANSQGVFKPNPFWYRGKPNFDEVVLKPVSPNLLNEALKTGQADITFTNLQSPLYEDLNTSPNLKIYEWYGLQNDYRYIAYNTTATPFNDKALRQALAYAVDRSTLIKLAENGRAIPQYTFVPENSPFFNKDVPRYDFDLEKTKKLLTEGGYKLEGANLLGKDGKQLKFTILYVASDTQGKIVAAYIQQQLKQVGIQVEIESKDPNSYLLQAVTKKYEALVGFAGGLNFPDPDDAAYYYTSDGVFNAPGYKDARIDQIFKDGSRELDNAKRKQLYGEAMRLLAEAVPSQVFYTRINFIAANKNLGGVVPNKSGRIDTNYALARWFWVQ